MVRYSSPRRPLLTNSPAARQIGSLRDWCITPKGTPVRRAASTMASAPDTVTAMGFSEMTGLPRSMA